MYAPHHDEVGGVGGARLGLGCGLEGALLQRGSHWIRPRPPLWWLGGSGEEQKRCFFNVF